MTYEEAICRLKDHFRIHDDGRLTPYLDEAVAMAYAAMEKQIQKKPDDTYEDSLDDECAVCGTFIFERDKYCPRCGQAIRWE